MDLFGLSRAEAAIAGGLMEGRRPEEIAERRNLRITTVRTHICSIYLKTGMSRQAELVRLLLQVGGPHRTKCLMIHSRPLIITDDVIRLPSA